MSSQLWWEAILQLNQKFKATKQKVTNCGQLHCPYRNERFESNWTHLHAPNVTSVLHQLDQVIIPNFKRNYRRLLVKEWIKATHSNLNFRASILNATQYIFKSWNDVSGTMTENCFQAWRFLTRIQEHSSKHEEEPEDTEEDVSLAQLFKEQTKHGKNFELDKNSYIRTNNDAFITSYANPKFMMQVWTNKN